MTGRFCLYRHWVDENPPVPPSMPGDKRKPLDDVSPAGKALHRALVMMMRIIWA